MTEHGKGYPLFPRSVFPTYIAGNSETRCKSRPKLIGVLSPSAPQQPTTGPNTHQGAVYVFVEPATGWTTGTETAKLLASDGAELDHLGSSARISADGNTIVSGAVRAAIGSNALQGAAYVFLKPVTGWTSGTQTFKLTASDGAANDVLG